MELEEHRDGLRTFWLVIGQHERLGVRPARARRSETREDNGAPGPESVNRRRRLEGAPEKRGGWVERRQLR